MLWLLLMIVNRVVVIGCGNCFAVTLAHGGENEKNREMKDRRSKHKKKKDLKMKMRKNKTNGIDCVCVLV